MNNIFMNNTCQHKKIRLIMGVLFAVFTISQNTVAQEMGPVSGNAEEGALLYYQHGCYTCHGYSGYGRQDLNNTDSPILNNVRVFTAYLRERADIAPVFNSAAMPNYPANALSDDKVEDIYAYIRSMSENNPEISDVPTFQSILESAQRPYQP